jgi:hypothetical protein
MFGRTEVTAAGGGAVGSRTAAPSGPPNLSGDLGGLLSTTPWFRVRVGGYDRLQVDNYVAWAESELTTGRRQIEHLLVRYGVCSAELEISRRLLAQVPKGQDVSPVTDRVRDMLRLAAEEAQAMVEAAAEEGDRLRAEARLEADARLRKAHQIKELAADTADEMRELAERDRAQAAAALQRARAEAAELVRGVALERDRLIDEAAEARARLAAVQAEMDDLCRQRDDARVSLRRLTDGIGEALALATGGPPDRFLVFGNTVQAVEPVPS